MARCSLPGGQSCNRMVDVIAVHLLLPFPLFLDIGGIPLVRLPVGLLPRPCCRDVFYEAGGWVCSYRVAPGQGEFTYSVLSAIFQATGTIEQYFLVRPDALGQVFRYPAEGEEYIDFWIHGRDFEVLFCPMPLVLQEHGLSIKLSRPGDFFSCWNI